MTDYVEIVCYLRFLMILKLKKEHQYQYNLIEAHQIFLGREYLATFNNHSKAVTPVWVEQTVTEIYPTGLKAGPHVFYFFLSVDLFKFPQLSICSFHSLKLQTYLP